MWEDSCHTIGTQRLCVLIDHRLVPRTQAVHDAHVVLRLSREACDLLAFYNRLLGVDVKQVGENGRTVAASTSCVRNETYDVHRNGNLRLTQQTRYLHASTPSQRFPATVLREDNRSGPRVLQTRKRHRTVTNVSNGRNVMSIARTDFLVQNICSLDVGIHVFPELTALVIILLTLLS
jgi:hypothetical protein